MGSAVLQASSINESCLFKKVIKAILEFADI